jgi:nicotinamide-nucleotide adenylyltransferase
VKTGLLLGRFQPFHNGHLFALRLILRENDRAVVVIGSAQASHDSENPFSAGERYDIIRATQTGAVLARTAVEHDYHQRKQCSGTEIRAMMAGGRPWERHVPKGVAAYVKGICGVERVKSIG